MKLFVFGDNHGKINWLREVNTDEFDMFVCTGDFFPNCSRGNAQKEVNFQAHWFDQNESFLREIFSRKPALWVGGNHDYICPAKAFQTIGCDVTLVSPGGETIDGVTFAGFGNITYIIGEWNRETDHAKLKEIVEETFLCKLDVLVTHAPPASILDDGWGVEPLLTALTYREHNIHTHLFGHIHINGGQMVERMGVKFYNCACNPLIVEV